MSVSLGVSIVIFCLIAAREWLPAWMKIWRIMTAGAIVMLVSGQIAPTAALDAVDWNVLLYLFAVFSIGTALYQSGVSHRIAARLAAFRSPAWSLAAFLLTFAGVAALLTNDAAAIIGTPIAFVLAARARVDPKVFLIGLCAAVTVGSMPTPIGNPQNLLIAASGHLPAPLFTFVIWLIVPTVLSLLFTIWWLGRALAEAPATTSMESDPSPEEQALWPSLLSVACLAVFVIADSVVATVRPEISIELGIAAAIACIPAYLFSRGRLRILLDLDWPTLVFFVAMFIVTGALIESGSLQQLLGDFRARMGEPLVTASIAFLGSQIFSNVPLVDMYLKLLQEFEVANLMMLSSISTLAGNVFIISAASNVIVVQQADRFGQSSFTFTEFTKAVLPIAAVSVAITIAWVLFLEAMLA